MKYWYFFLIVVVFGCRNKEGFYTDYTEEDLYRLPLIKPYRLIQLYGVDEGVIEDKFKCWGLDLIKGDTIFPNDRHTNVTEINVNDSLIYGRGDNAKYPPGYWFVIILGKGIEMIFKSEEKWVYYLKEHSIDDPKLLNVWKVFEEFKSKNRLPWHKNE